MPAGWWSYYRRSHQRHCPIPVQPCTALVDHSRIRHCSFTPFQHVWNQLHCGSYPENPACICGAGSDWDLQVIGHPGRHQECERHLQQTSTVSPVGLPHCYDVRHVTSAFPVLLPTAYTQPADSDQFYCSLPRRQADMRSDNAPFPVPVEASCSYGNTDNARQTVDYNVPMTVKSHSVELTTASQVIIRLYL